MGDESGSCWKTVGSVMARCLLLTVGCGEIGFRPAVVETGAEKWRFPLVLSTVRFFSRRLPDLGIQEPGELKCIDSDLRGRL